jgi:hypothetical protein
MVFQYVTTCSNFLTISGTEYIFLSQQSAMSVRKRDRFLSPNRISELVWDRESEEAGASNDCIIYLCNRILCIFRQPLKYLYFSYSFLDEVRKYHVEILDSPLEKHNGKDNDTGTKSTNVGLSRFKMVSRVNIAWCEKLLVKCWESMMCVWSNMPFLIPPHQGTNPQILKLEFTMQIGAQNRKVSKINWKLYIFLINFPNLGTKYFYFFLTEVLVSMIYSQHNADYCTILLS